MTDEQFTRIISAFEKQTQLINYAQDQQTKLLKKINSAVQLIGLFIIFVILVTACNAIMGAT
jgi:hypothetical protein